MVEPRANFDASYGKVLQELQNIADEEQGSCDRRRLGRASRGR
jgi:hypothetical protein